MNLSPVLSANSDLEVRLRPERAVFRWEGLEIPLGSHEVDLGLTLRSDPGSGWSSRPDFALLA